MLELQHISYETEENREILHDISLTIKDHHKNEQDRSIPTGKRRKRHDAPEFGTSR